MKRELQIFRDGDRRNEFLIEPLHPGEQGNLQTVRLMAEIARQDAAMPDIRAFVNREIVRSVSGFDDKGEVAACFEFCRDQIRYRKDPANVERVADLWSAMYALNTEDPEGDCGIKSLALLTCLGAIGYKPFLVVVKQKVRATAFNHVYCGLMLNNQYHALDPTPEEFVAGEEVQFWERKKFLVFADS